MALTPSSFRRSPRLLAALLIASALVSILFILFMLY